MTDIPIDDRKADLIILDTASASHPIDTSTVSIFCENEEVLSRWNDGLLYIGNVLQVDCSGEQCLLRFEDSSEHWTKFKDINKCFGQGSDSDCCVCQCDISKPPNEIVVCDNCGVGYHQNCHIPTVLKRKQRSNVGWNCRLCVFGNTAKIGGALKKGPFAKEMQSMKQTLPYNPKLLTWDAQHRSNREQTYCYCGGPGDWCFKMLQCNHCKQWFHEACIQCLEKPLLFGDRFYVFICSVCTAGPEFIKRLELKWLDLIHLVLFNISLQDGRKYFDLEDCIVGFIEKNWGMLQIQGSVASTKPEARVGIVKSTLESNRNRFKCGNEIRKRTSIWGLRSKVPPPAPRINYSLQELFAQNLTSQIKKKLKLHSELISLSTYAPTSKKLRQESDSVSQTGTLTHRRNGHTLRNGHHSLTTAQPDEPTPESDTLFNKLRQRLKDALKNSKIRCTLLPQLTEDKKISQKRPKKQSKEFVKTVVRKPGKPANKQLLADKANSHQTKPKRKYCRKTPPSSSASSNKTSRNCDTLDGVDVEDASLKGNLDTIIPPQSSFEGSNNPFYDIGLDHQSPRRSHKRHLSQEDVCVANTRRGKRKRVFNGTNNGTQNGQNVLDISMTNKPINGIRKLDMAVHCITDSPNFLKKYNYSNGTILEGRNTPSKRVNGYLRLAKRGQSREGPKILGTRITNDGKLQYLIEWN